MHVATKNESPSVILNVEFNGCRTGYQAQFGACSHALQDMLLEQSPLIGLDAEFTGSLREDGSGIAANVRLAERQPLGPYRPSKGKGRSVHTSESGQEPGELRQGSPVLQAMTGAVRDLVAQELKSHTSQGKNEQSLGRPAEDDVIAEGVAVKIHAVRPKFCFGKPQNKEHHPTLPDGDIFLLRTLFPRGQVPTAEPGAHKTPLAWTSQKSMRKRD